MKIFQNFFKNNEKLNANEVSIIDNNKGIQLDKYLGNLSSLNTVNKTSFVGAINEANSKSSITVMASENKQYAQNNYLVVDAYDNVINKLGTNIEMTSNGQFKVNKDINLLFSFYNNVQPWSAGNQLIMYKISINNEEPYMQQGFECGSQWGNSGQSLSNFVLKLKKDDTVALKIYSQGNTCTLRSGSLITLVEL